MKVLFAARLVDFKDPLTFISASVSLPKLDFVVAGDGYLMKHCRATAKSNVTFLGWIPQKELAEIMQPADIFCQLSPYENIWSASLIEAMKSKMAVICTDAGYTSQFLTDKIHVLLTPPRNSGKLIQKILYLSENEHLRVTLGENAADYVTDNLAIDKIAYEVHLMLENLHGELNTR